MWRPSERWRSWWDGEFESPLLQQRVCKLSVPHESSCGSKQSEASRISTRGWDREFESPLLQQPVCLSGEPRGCRRKAPHFGGGLRVAGDVRRGVQAANRDSFALSL